MKRGKFISIEGIEGAGKSTVLKHIADLLNIASIPTHLTREPGGTPLAEKMRELLLHTDVETVSPRTELLLMFAGREQHLQNVIIPTLEKGVWVISDRFVDASYAYQGGGRHLPLNAIQWLDQWVVADRLPDLTFLLDTPAALGMQRAASRPFAKDRIEQEKLSFFERVRAHYLQRAKANPERIKCIDASRTLSEVEQQISTILDEFVRG